MLIPTNCVRIFPAYHPKGWTVAQYDAEGFTHGLRWFDDYGKAVLYYNQLLNS